MLSRVFLPIVIFWFSISTFSLAQNSSPYDTLARKIVTTGLQSGKAYTMLTELCTTIGHRLSGSPQAAQAVAWGKNKMNEMGLENVRLESLMVPHWVRGEVEEAFVIHPVTKEKISLSICALGGSIRTPAEGITAEIIEVHTFEELQSLGEKAKGKIIFFNRPMERSKIMTFEAYGGAVNQRGSGAIEAAKAGGVAALVRSMTTAVDDFPHTGSMGYVDTVKKVPSAAISTLDANFLSELLSKEKNVKLHLQLSCETLPEVPSANVIGEILGSEKPNEIVLIGGHLDSWDKGQGAHDDGAGISHTLEAMRLLKELGLRPKRTIRAILFMNEENGLRGGKNYAEKHKNETHVAAIETDAGGASPRGFGVSTDSIRFEKIKRWESLFEIIDADRIKKGGGGADISELGRQGIPTIGLRVDPQRYFDYHHSDNDTIDKVNERELELGATALAILVYLLAEEGL
ncbi:MAG: M20/M25/M40 family metallo-hydrolase [Ignavibacteriales bacterium]|nr:M20/M25/M40 family metallo-hydrolase [Ignavibacteriales bacterium]